MSTAKVITILHPSSAVDNIVNDASGNVAVGNNLTVAGTSTLTGNVTAAGTLAMGSSFKRNRIINGNMLIDQRNAGASVATSSGVSVYTVDRWQAVYSATSKFTVQQNAGSVTSPTGYKNYLGATSSSAYTVGTGDYFGIVQFIEGYNIADFGWGAAGASSITLSFWVRSSVTGTYTVAVRNGATTRSYPATYVVNSANTWEQKTITVAGDTTGTWASDNSAGISLWFSLGAGSTYTTTANAWAAGNYTQATGSNNFVATNSATFYITGVQLEVGTKATPYEMQIYSDQLAQCQRYFQKYVNPPLKGIAAGTTAANRCGMPLEVTMRASPTSAYNGTCYWFDGTGTGTVTSALVVYGITTAIEFDFNFVTGTTVTYRPIVFYVNAASTGYVTADAEL